MVNERGPVRHARALDCPHCGGTVKVHTRYSISAICTHCKSTLDTSDDRVALIQAASTTDSDRHQRCHLVLGRKGRLNGVTWQVVGFLARSEVNDRFRWGEYLLFNPYRGFRWLVEFNGKWTFIAPLRLPEPVASGNIRVSGTEYRRNDRYTAQVDRVKGEFYWRVQAGDRADVAEYESFGASTLTFEMSEDNAGNAEINWSRGRPVGVDRVARAFGVKKSDLPGMYQQTSAPDPYAGVPAYSSSSGSNEPSPWLMALLVAGIVFFVYLDIRYGDGSSSSSYTGK